jgi:glycosyltransferase involved in cell wall biosynthesis
MSRYRIALIADGDPSDPAKAGSGSPFYLAKALREAGHEVFPLDASLHGVSRLLAAALSFDIDRSRWRAKFHLGRHAFALRSRQATLQIRRLTTSQQIDCVLMYGNDCLPTFDSTTPLFLYCDNFALNTAENAFSNFSKLSQRDQELAIRNESLIFRRARRIFTLSRFVEERFHRLAGVPLEKLETVYAGFSIDPSNVAIDREQSICEQRILFVGRDWVYKGGNELLAAFKQVREHMPDAVLDIVGPRDLPPELGDDPKIKFWGYLAKSSLEDARTLHRLYEQATIFVLPTLYDSFGIAILEAMSSGLPVVATNISAIPEIIEDGKTGFTVNPRDVTSLAASMRALLEDRELAAKMGSAGRKRALDKFSWRAVAERVSTGITRSLL